MSAESALRSELGQLAATLAVEAGRMAAAGRRRGVAGAQAKSSPTDVATEWDLACERMIRQRLGAARPEDSIIGEEGDAHRGTSGISWLIDPIDGTTNFVYDLPGYATSVAACDEHGPLAGAVFIPSADELFRAERGAGATRNGEPIRCSEATELGLALVATGFGYHPQRRAVQGRIVAELLPQIRDIRRCGAAAVDLCHVACGRVDAYYEIGLGPWDLAAGQLVASEAGCTLSALDGGPIRPGSVLVAAPGLHAALRHALELAGSGAADGIM